MNREAWCYWMMFGYGGAMGVLAAQLSEWTYIVFVAACLFSAWHIMRIDDREFLRRIKERADSDFAYQAEMRELMVKAKAKRERLQSNHEVEPS